MSEHVLTVQEFSTSLKRCVEGTFADVRVKGEVSGMLIHSSGHMYFALKDAHAVLDCVCWRGQVRGLTLRPEDGMEVVCVGKATTYAMRSKYQLMLYDIQLAGVGALLKLIEERKKKLEQEGLFRQECKRPLPKYVQKIVVITSPTGAVIRDILHRIRDRYPCHVQVWPAIMQGADAVASVCAALDGIAQSVSPPDVILIARGGGSIEDLMPFNDEGLVRAVFQCTIPVVSAIGHETDTTLLDYVADVRAPTPTGAAEIMTPNRNDLLVYIEQYALRSFTIIHRMLDAHSQMLRHMGTTPQRLVEMKWLAFDELWARLKSAIEKGFEQKSFMVKSISIAHEARVLRDRWSHQTQVLLHDHYKMTMAVQQYVQRAQQGVHTFAQLVSSVSPYAVMKRGFAMVEKSDKLVGSAETLCPNDSVTIILSDGRRKARIDA